MNSILVCTGEFNSSIYWWIQFPGQRRRMRSMCQIVYQMMDSMVQSANTPSSSYIDWEKEVNYICYKMAHTNYKFWHFTPSSVSFWHLNWISSSRKTKNKGITRKHSLPFSVLRGTYHSIQVVSYEKFHFFLVMWDVECYIGHHSMQIPLQCMESVYTLQWTGFSV